MDQRVVSNMLMVLVLIMFILCFEKCTLNNVLMEVVMAPDSIPKIDSFTQTL